jgi:hypothetical protein
LAACVREIHPSVGRRVGLGSVTVTSSPRDQARTSPGRPPSPPPSELTLPPLAISAVASNLTSSERWGGHKATPLRVELRKLARPRDGASCFCRCAVMPTLCSGAVPPVVVTPAPTVGWDGHVNAISSRSCGRRCPLSPCCPTSSATGAVALIAHSAARGERVPMAERVTGGRPQCPRGQALRRG